MEKPDMSSISKTADNVAEHARSAALVARASLVELGSQALRLFNNIREREANGALLASHLGRRREPHIFSPILWFATGAAVAGGALFLLAPRGADLRARVGSLMNTAKDAIGQRERQAVNDMMNEGGGSTPRDGEELAAAH